MRRRWIVFAPWLVLAAVSTAPAQPRPAATPASVRVTMDTLHRLGGVPAGWMLSPPRGDLARGRRLFAEQGCPACHVVAGEAFPAPTAPGPELSGMGSHHPAAYFVESILNPEAVLVDGPGYIAADGRSAMPSYPEMTIAQLADIVAFLQSLTMPGMQHAMQPVSPPPPNEADLPPPPKSAAGLHLVQVYDVLPGKLAAFEEWFQREGGADFLEQQGVLGVETWVDRSRGSARLITVIDFRDEASFRTFHLGPDGQKLGARFDEFVGPHGHDVLAVAPLYRVGALSTPKP